MVFLKGIILTCSFIICVNCNLLLADFMALNYQDSYKYAEVVDWWKDYETLPKASGTIANRVSEAIQYEQWLTEPLEEVIRRLSDYYAEPLIGEIISSVSDFKQVPSDWHYSYRVDNVYLLQRSGGKTIVIAEISEVLIDEVVDKGLALIALDKNLKISEQVFRWEY
ncbi:MAG: hypothetical protein APF76_10020 [Desulfitibacter sp. BRH_c19]|nr:MAG: hypothetical protein APF76_10020 [Desulfitibacter sp. BRH_c19]